MGGLLSKFKETVSKSDPEPSSVPEVDDEAEEDVARKPRRRPRVDKKFLTGSLTPKRTGKKTIFS